MITPVSVKCRSCDNPFFTTEKRINDGRGKYCSRKCLYSNFYKKYNYRGNQYTIVGLAKLANIPKTAMTQRIEKHGYTVEKAVNEPYRAKHGMSKDRFYRIWWGMLQRATTNNKNSRLYKFYAGKGIGISEEWKNFLSFKEDMYEKYIESVAKNGEKNTTIDRIDNSKGYSKSNCRWATINQQVDNRSTTRKYRYTYNGKKISMPELVEVSKLPRPTLFARINKYGWSIDKAISVPIKNY